MQTSLFKSKKAGTALKYLGIVLMLLTIQSTNFAQIKVAPNRAGRQNLPLHMLPSLGIISASSTNCEIDFQLKAYGSDSGPFKVDIKNSDDLIAETFSIDNLKVNEKRAFKFRFGHTGVFTILVDPDHAVNKDSSKNLIRRVEIKQCLR